MAVIKGSTPDTLLKQAVVLDLGDITRQAAKLRVAAENQASEILDKAEQQARQLINDAEQKGLEQGYAKGLEQGTQEGQQQGHAEALQQASQDLEQLVLSWSECLRDIDTTRDRLESEVKRSALEFAIVFAEKLTHRVIEVDPTVVVDQLAQTLQYILRPLEVTVKVHPDDRALVEQSVPELLNEFEQVQHIKLVEDESVGRGGVITQYGQGQIDASIDTQLDRLVEMMLPLDEAAKRQIEEQAKAAQAQTQAEAQDQVQAQATENAGASEAEQGKADAQAAMASGASAGSGVSDAEPQELAEPEEESEPGAEADPEPEAEADPELDADASQLPDDTDDDAR